MAAPLQQAVTNQLARQGFEIRRHSAARRQRLLAAREVDVVIDVGAARGAYGQQLRKFGYGGRLVSFEPLAGAFARLEGVIEHDPRWTAHRLALGEESGYATINVASNSDSSSLLPMLKAHSDADPTISYVAEETVTVARLDDVADGLIQGTNPFLKIDTQGFERHVLLGAKKTTQRCVGLQLELSFVPLYKDSMRVDEAIAWAYDQGFHLVGFEQGFAAPSGQIMQVDGIFLRDR